MSTGTRAVNVAERSYRVAVGAEDPASAPRFATEAEADVYAAHTRRRGAIQVRVEPATGPATHLVDELSRLLRRDRPNGIPQLIALASMPDSALDYDYALEEQLYEVAESGRHAVIATAAAPGPATEELEVGLAVVPGDSATVWYVSLRYTGVENAARFIVDVGSNFWSAPGMTPDSKSGYAAWNPDAGTVALVSFDPDLRALTARSVENFDGYLPSVEGPLRVDEVADLAQLIADVAIGWR